MKHPYRTPVRRAGSRERVYLREPAASLRWALHLATLALVLLVGACGSTAVQRESTSAHLMARAWNDVAEPTMVTAYESEQRQAVDRVCPAGAPCDAAAARAAVQTIRAAWAPVWASLEAVRVAHDAWRVELERCRALGDDAGATCSPELDRLGGRFVASAGVLRCLLRAVGHPELDPFPGPPPSCPFTPAAEVSDAGR